MRSPILVRVLSGSCLVITVLAACATLKEVPTTHIVMVNGRGNPVDPTGNLLCSKKPCATGSESGLHVNLFVNDYGQLERGTPSNRPPGTYANYLDTLFGAILNGTTEKEGKDKAPIKCEKTKPEGKEVCKRRILIFVHGGLNTQVGTVERARDLMTAIPKEHYYPIFINWQSSLFSSYADHLVHVRQGISWDGWELVTTPLFVPVYFAADVARAIARAPIVWVFLTWNWVKSVRNTGTIEEAVTIAKELEEEYRTHPTGDALKIAHDPVDRRELWDAALAHTTATLTIPTKLIGSMFIDAFGKSAWEIMLRRTHLLYNTEREFFESGKVALDEGKRESPTSRIKPDGGLSVFMRGLQDMVTANGGPDAWDITLVGHSMGTIVLGQMIRDFGLKTAADAGGTKSTAIALPFNKIVYMAGAATVRDYQDSVFPYLRENPDAVVFHLVLHPKAELRERFDPGIPYLDLPPRGSLLVWVDEFLASPETPLDRTVGRFENLLQAVHNTPEELLGRIHIKAFGAGREVRAPQKHGDFTTHFKFWNPPCWWGPGPELDPDCYCP